MKILNKSNDKFLATEVILADTFISRLKGLMLKKNLEKGMAMLIYPCNMIHTSFMKFPIDVIFLSDEYEVISVIENILPWHISPLVRKSIIVLELPSGAIKNTNTKIGDFIEIIL